MATNNEERKIKIILDGQQVNASLKQMEASAALMNNQIRKMSADDPNRAKLLGDFKEMKQRISAAKEEMYGVQKATLAAQSSMSGFSGFMKTALGTAAGFLTAGGIENVMAKVVGFFGDSSTAAKEFEFALSSLSAITGATGADLQFYEEQAQLIGETTSLSASQAVEAFKLIGSAKPELLANKEALAAVTQEAIALAEASGMELPEAANALASSLNQFGAGADQAGRYINVMAAGAKEGSAEITETAAALKNAGTVAAGANVSFEATNAMIQALAEISIKGGEAGTGLRNVLLTLQSGADDTNPAVVGLEKALENLGKKNHSTAELAKMFGKENVVVANQLVNSREKITQLTTAMTGTSVAYEQAATNMDNLEGDVKALDSATESLQIGIGKGLNLAIREGVKLLTGFILVIKETPRFLYENRDIIATLAVAILAMNAANIKTAASTLYHSAVEKGRAIATRSTAAAQWVLNAAMTANPIGLVVAAVAALVGGFVILYNRSEKVRAVVSGLWGAIKALAVGVKDNVMAVFSGLGDVLAGVFTMDLKKIKEGMGKAMKAAFELTPVGMAIGKGKEVAAAYSKGHDDKLAEEAAKKAKKDAASGAKKVKDAAVQGKAEGEAFNKEDDKAKKEREKKEKEHQENLKKAREEYQKAALKADEENAKLSIEVRLKGVEKEVALLKLQHEKELKEIAAQREAVKANIAASAEEKAALLKEYDEQEVLLKEQFDATRKEKEDADKAAKAEKEKEDKEAALEKWYEDLEEEEEIKLAAIEEQFLNAMISEQERDQLALDAKKARLAQELADLEANGQGKTLAAMKLRNELLKIEQEKVDKEKQLIKDKADFEQQMSSLRLQLAGDVVDGIMGFLDQEGSAYAAFKQIKKGLSIAEIAMNLQKELSANAATAATMGPFGAAYLPVANTISVVRAGFGTAKVVALEHGGNTVPMELVNGGWQMASGYSGGSIGAFAKGGDVKSARLGLIGEAGAEWVMPNWMMRSPKYASTYRWLESERRSGGVKAFATGGPTTAPDVPMPQFNSAELVAELRSMRTEMGAYIARVDQWSNSIKVDYHAGNAVEVMELRNQMQNRSGF